MEEEASESYSVELTPGPYLPLDIVHKNAREYVDDLDYEFSLGGVLAQERLHDLSDVAIQSLYQLSRMSRRIENYAVMGFRDFVWVDIYDRITAAMVDIVDLDQHPELASYLERQVNRAYQNEEDDRFDDNLVSLESVRD